MTRWVRNSGMTRLGAKFWNDEWGRNYGMRGDGELVLKLRFQDELRSNITHTHISNIRKLLTFCNSKWFNIINYYSLYNALTM